MSTTRKVQSESQTIRLPEQAALKVDIDSSQSVSYYSQKSSSTESFESSSPGESSDGNVTRSEQQNVTNNSKLMEGECSPLRHDSTMLKSDAGASVQQWLANEVMPSSVLLPDQHSTPVKDFLSTVSEEQYNESEGESMSELFMPGELNTPILGYETMEARSKFTLFKIRVEKTVSSIEPTSWFVFRRYSDFVYLNENEPVRDFFCLDDPPGPHDSLEESRALCDTLELTVYNLSEQVQEKSYEIDLLKEELGLYKSQVNLLTTQLRMLNKKKNANGGLSSPFDSAFDVGNDSEQDG